MVARLVPQWIVPTLRLRIASRMFAFASEWVATPIHRWIYNPENVERGVAAHLMVNGFVNIPGKLAGEFVRWAAQGGVVRCGETPITVGLAALDRPALFVAGAADRIAPPSSVALAYEAWGGHDKSMRIVGVEQGAAADYGHGDLAIGRFAAEDVFDPVAAFLSAASEEPATAH
jgi:polyhydroxyalkanoate synthase